jgi:hypothetical protein
MRTIASTIAFQPAESVRTATPSIFGIRELAFALAHIPLALAMYLVQDISTLHAWATMLIGTFIALLSRRPEPLIYVCAYVAGGEVLWRMTHAQALHQFGKYICAWILLIGLIRFRSSRSVLWPVLFFLLLIPSIPITFFKFDTLPMVKEAVSYNLSGPFLLAVSALFFSRIWINEKDIQWMLYFFVAAIVGICTMTAYATLTAQEIRFITESNWVTSAGYNPVAVSDMLGFAGLACFLLFLLNRQGSIPLKTILIAGWIAFTIECVLTFSRQGIYMQVGGAIAACYYLFRYKGFRFKLLMLLTVLLLLFFWIVVPRLDTFTSGKFTARFEDTDTTHRDVLASDDVKLFLEEPALGVGPGRSSHFRSIENFKAHTEYTRLLSEHGLPGLIALGVLGLMLYQRWKNFGDFNVILAPLMVWGLLFLAVNATRLAAPVFLLGFCFITVVADPQSKMKSAR